MRGRYREMLVDWLVEVHEEFALSSDTMYLAVAYLDRYLCVRGGAVLGDTTGAPGKLQLLGCACMFAAAKYEENGGRAPKVADYIYISDGAFSRKQLQDAELDLCDALDWRLNVATVKVFHRRCLAACRATNLEKFLAVYLMELTLLDARFSAVLPDLCAAACVFLARATMRVRAPTFKIGCPSTNPRNRGGPIDPPPDSPLRAPWTPTLHHYSGYAERDLLPTAERLRAVHAQWFATRGQPVEVLRNTSDCNESAVSHSYGLDAHCRSVLRDPVTGRARCARPSSCARAGRPS